MKSTELDASDFIQAHIEEPEEVSLKQKKTSPFDFMGAVSHTKKDIVKESPEIAKDYIPYITNKGFGFFPDSVLYANEMNLYSNIPSINQYYYYMASLRKRSRRSKWFKLEKNDDLTMVQQVYQVRAEIAKQYLKILSNADLEKLRALTDTGEDTKRKK
jgi:tyrosyl-tRNA synthetase